MSSILRQLSSDREASCDTGFIHRSIRVLRQVDVHREIDDIHREIDERERRERQDRSARRRRRRRRHSRPARARSWPRGLPWRAARTGQAHALGRAAARRQQLARTGQEQAARLAPPRPVGLPVRVFAFFTPALGLLFTPALGLQFGTANWNKIIN